MTKVDNLEFLSNINRISIDSFRINIPMRYVKVIDENIIAKLATYTINTSTQEVLTEKQVKANSIVKEFDNYHFRFALDKSFGEDKIVILLNSKCLGESYFNGITTNNIESIYNQLINCKVVEFSYNIFLESSCVDVDYKTDSVMSYKDFKASIKTVYDCGKLSNNKDGGGLLYNSGIEFSKRETSKFKSLPFFKIYHKEIELDTKSKSFANRYLSRNNYKDGVRMEFTVKNKKHFSYLGVEHNTLSFILNLSDKQKQDMLSSVVNKHLNKREVKPRTTNENMNPTEKVTFMLMNLLLEKGLSIDGVITYVLEDFSGTAKNRKRKDLTHVYESYIKGSIAEKRSDNMNTFFDFIGWKR
jgi:hypothetical protein